MSITKAATQVTQKKRHLSSLAKSYLLFYNGAQFLGWISILLVIFHHYTENDNCSGLWKKEEYLVKFFQTLAALEVIHALIGIVPSNPAVTLVQVFSRVFLVWGVVHSFARVHNSITIPLMLAAWTVTEIVRYSYYFMHLLSWVPYPLLWCRYTFFILLYPLGVIGEVMTTIFALPYIRDSQWYSISLPNPANISFSYYYCVLAIMLGYVPGFPQMYLHMMGQRKKILSPSPKKNN